MNKKQRALDESVYQKIMYYKKHFGESILEQAEKNILNLSDDDIITYYSECFLENKVFKDIQTYKHIYLPLDDKVLKRINRIQTKYKKRYETVHSKRTSSQKNFNTKLVNAYRLNYNFCVYVWIKEIEKLINMEK